MANVMLSRPAPLLASVAREMDEVQNRLRRFFNEGFPVEGLPVMEPVGWVPAVEILENDQELMVTAELPGMTKENVEVTFEDDILTIRGEKKEERKEGDGSQRFHLLERTYGAFQRSFTLPRTIDGSKISADFRDGVLTVHMPKTAQARAKGRKIEIAAK